MEFMYEEELTHLKQHESQSCDRNGKSEVGGHSRKVWVEVYCQGQTLLTLLKTKNCSFASLVKSRDLLL